MMGKDEVCNQLCAVCNSLNDLTVTGIQNAEIVVRAHTSLRNTLAFLLSCDIVTPDQKRSEQENGGD